MDIKNLKVWVLAGQSNMEGCGYLKDCNVPDPRVMCFTSAGNWEVAEEPLHRHWESYTPVHQAINREWNPQWTKGKTDEELAREVAAGRTHGAGPGLPFAVELANATGDDIGLIACAHGGTSLEQWNPAHAPEKGTLCLYGAMLDRIRKAGGQLQGILWYQGESDCGPGLDESYEKRFTEWVESVRRDTNIPDLPVIVVQLGRFVPAPQTTFEQAHSWDIVRDALVNVAMKVPNVAAVAAIDLELTDLIHVSTPGHMRLGKRMAQAALGIAAGKSYFSGPRVISAESKPLETVSPWSGHGGMVLKCQGVTGGFNPGRHMGGFGIYNEKGEPHEKVCLIEASADPADPSSIRLLVNTPPDETVWVGYGRGLAPYCNVVDDADNALLAFAMKVRV